MSNVLPSPYFLSLLQLILLLSSLEPGKVGMLTPALFRRVLGGTSPPLEGSGAVFFQQCSPLTLASRALD